MREGAGQEAGRDTRRHFKTGCRSEILRVRSDETANIRADVLQSSRLPSRQEWMQTVIASTRLQCSRNLRWDDRVLQLNAAPCAAPGALACGSRFADPAMSGVGGRSRIRTADPLGVNEML